MRNMLYFGFAQRIGKRSHLLEISHERARIDTNSLKLFVFFRVSSWLIFVFLQSHLFQLIHFALSCRAAPRERLKLRISS
jgi:hypothetical protein